MKNGKKVAFSGVKPTGRPHIGNYFGAMKQFVDLQKTYDCHFAIVDYHALNFIQNGKEMSELIIDLAIDYLAIGIDPKKSIVFKQSDVSAHTELAWIFDTITTMPYLMRAHAFKDAEAKNKEISVGTFNYPMLMACDILLYSPDIVPVGQDQKQHVEITRDTAEKFNRTFGETFKLPEALILSNVAVVPGTDGQKMSKSYNNTIPLFADRETITKAIMSIKTDSKGVEESKDPDQDTIFALHKLFLSGPALEELRDRYTNGGIGYKESKEILIENVDTFIAPLREKREMIAKDKDMVLDILKEGGEKARHIADKKLAEAKEKIGVKFY
jgi:tryptophanyl-tRNA synthetase